MRFLVALTLALWYLRFMGQSRSLCAARRLVALASAFFLLQLAGVSHLHIGHHSGTARAFKSNTAEAAFAAPPQVAGEPGPDCPICLIGAHSEAAPTHTYALLHRASSDTNPALWSDTDTATPGSRGPASPRGPPALSV